ncbi:MAG TPA: polyribonucleotide nucleotidyltransferase, partial [Dehalococcoidia bacterium]|nr:polyribonucleotide nucleotidyltransferase [Dehalococcoidia bacterium]
MPRIYECIIGGRSLIIETGKLAWQAGGAVTVRYGDAVVLVTVCATDQPREGVDFMPLTVDYEARLYAAGRIPGSFFRREGRPNTEAILAARLTDRSLRPLFPKGFRNEVQVVDTVLSADQENDTDILSPIGASAALTISDVPFQGPIGCIRVGYINGEYVLNPTFSQLRESLIDVVVAGTREAAVMIEGGAKEAPEELILEAIRIGQEANQALIALQDEMAAELGRPKMAVSPLPEVPEELRSAVAAFLAERQEALVADAAKQERQQTVAEARQALAERLADSFPSDLVALAFERELQKMIRRSILEGRRPDGRPPTELRPVSCEVGLLPRTHGSGLFMRGETQVMTILTLGSLGQEQRLDGLAPEETKRFLHHYNFPGYSTGEVRRIGTTSRREIGHGALAERALEPIIPSQEEFPYTIRLVSEVLSSNGSTSMASICGSTMALMDGGVPIKAPVAGVAMGLITEGDRYTVLTDIIGLEDHIGDMDFKVAGTQAGVTAVQLDLKLTGVPHGVLAEALQRAREARLYILDVLRGTIARSRPELSRYAPRIYRLKIPVEKIGAVIGPGGRVIRSIIEETKCSIDVEDDGTVFVGATNQEMAQQAIRIIEGLTKEIAIGEIYTGRVTRLTGLGAFVEILPGKDG